MAAPLSALSTTAPRSRCRRRGGRARAPLVVCCSGPREGWVDLPRVHQLLLGAIVLRVSPKGHAGRTGKGGSCSRRPRGGNVTTQIFRLKARARWKEPSAAVYAHSAAAACGEAACTGPGGVFLRRSRSTRDRIAT